MTVTNYEQLERTLSDTEYYQMSDYATDYASEEEEVDLQYQLAMAADGEAEVYRFGQGYYLGG
jgi:hypothetical protein